MIGLIRAKERPIKDREAMLVFKTPDFFSVLASAMKRDEEKQRWRRCRGKITELLKIELRVGGLDWGRTQRSCQDWGRRADYFGPKCIFDPDYDL